MTDASIAANWIHRRAEPSWLMRLFDSKPFLVTHGLYDQVLPIENGRASRALLETLPVDLTYREYAMAHEINAESLTDVTSWLTERLDEAL